MRTPEAALLAELVALQRENPTEAKRRFDALTDEQLRSLSLELGLRLCLSAFVAARKNETLQVVPPLKSKAA